MTSRRVLVVDDNAIAADALVRLLTALECNAVSAYSAASARASLATEVDLILLDIGMPDMDGYEFIRILRNEMGLTTPIIALTGYGSSEDQKKALEAGFTAHLTKPIGVEDLRGMLANLSD